MKPLHVKYWTNVPDGYIGPVTKWVRGDYQHTRTSQMWLRYYCKNKQYSTFIQFGITESLSGEDASADLSSKRNWASCSNMREFWKVAYDRVKETDDKDLIEYVMACLLSA